MKQKIASLSLRIINKLFLNRMRQKVQFQYFFEYMHALSLKGMNYGSTNHISKSGELEVLKYVLAKCQNKSDIVIFDVGANIGGYTKACMDMFSGIQNISVHSFEPSIKTYNILSKNIINKNVTLHNIGLSDTKETANLYTSQIEGQSGLSSVFKRDLSAHKINLDLMETVHMNSVDIFCLENNITEIHFLKLDVEGNEMKALKGAYQMLKNNKINFIQFEFGGTNIDSRTFFIDFYNLLKDGFIIYRIVKDGLFEIKNYNEHREIFGSINFFAERK